MVCVLYCSLLDILWGRGVWRVFGAVQRNRNDGAKQPQRKPNHMALSNEQKHTLITHRTTHNALTYTQYAVRNRPYFSPRSLSIVGVNIARSARRQLGGVAIGNLFGCHKRHRRSRAFSNLHEIPR